MQPDARVMIRRLHPRTLAGALLIVSLAGESYMMSRHTAAGFVRETLATRSSPVAVAPRVGAGRDAASSAAALDQAERALEGLTDAASTHQIPLSELKSNPFQQQSPGRRDTTGASVTGSSSDDRAAVLTAVASLELESVLVSENKRSCTINGTACEEGQQIDGFTVETVASRSVTVSRGIYRFELTLSH